MQKLPLSIGILSWRGYKSLHNALKSYEKNGLNSMISSKFICLPEYTNEGINLSKKYGYKPLLYKKNLGILDGFKQLARKMPHGPLLLLENDLPLVENKLKTYKQLCLSLELLNKQKTAQIRLRSRKSPGLPFVAIEKYKMYWEDSLVSKFRRLIRPFKARKLIGTSVYVLKNPDLKHPRYITNVANGFYSVSTQVLNWSNLAIIVDREFYLKKIIKRAELVKNSKNINGFKNIEIQLNDDWWKSQDWEIILGPGLFSHERLSDRGY